jgi:hypothetical protein
MDPTSTMELCLMLPLAKNVLSLEEIAEYWSREINGIRTAPEIFNELLAAFWRSRLVLYGTTGRTPVDRRGLLRAISKFPEHPGFTIVESVDSIPLTATYRLDGGISIDTTVYVILPLDHDHWSNDIIESASEALADRSFEDFDGMMARGLRLLGSTREALGIYCELMGYNFPRFWLRTTEKPVSFGGRPSVMRQIAAEMTRRADLRVLAPTLRKEATALLTWANANIDEKMQLPQLQTIENGIRKQYKTLRAATALGDHKT